MALSLSLPSSASTAPARRAGRRGFTLIEVLVVIGIIMLLVGIALPIVNKAIRAARRTATANQLQVISAAIRAYHDDHKMYPPLATYATGANAGQPIPGTGFAALGRSLIAPAGLNPVAVDGAYTTTPPSPYGVGSHVLHSGALYMAIRDPDGAAPTDTNYWTPFNAYDGHDGPGFKLQRGDPDGIPHNTDDFGRGKTFGPYLASGFRTRGFAILDPKDKPILYFPATGRKIGPTVPYVDNPVAPNYGNAFYNASDSFVLSLEDMRYALGQTGLPGAAPITTQPFLLWAAGPDEMFGYNSDGRTDDVVNTDIILRKR